jgi:hypothetical protein
LVDQDGARIRAEFEYRSGNFITHGHDPAGCDMVVCWVADRELRPQIRIIELAKYYENLRLNPMLSGKDTSKNKTAIALDIIGRGWANKTELAKVFMLYHPSEQQREPVRFIARLISNRADPFVDNGILRTRRLLFQENIKYSVRGNREAMMVAKEILSKLGFSTSQSSNAIINLEE